MVKLTILILSVATQVTTSTGRLSSEAGVLLLLTSPDLDERGRALSAVEIAPALRQDGRIREAIVRLLTKEVENDLRVAAREHNSTRQPSLRRDQLSTLVKLAGENGWTEGATALAKADVYNAVGAMYSHGAATFPGLLAVVRTSAPPGVSSTYRARRLTVLRSLLGRGLLTVEQQRSLGEALIVSLSERADLELLGEALVMAADFPQEQRLIQRRAETIRQIVQARDARFTAMLRRFGIED